MKFKRNTLQRQIILEAVKVLNKHATAEQVCEHISKTHPTISKATVYRNLSQMAEVGELMDIGNFGGATRYDHNRNGHYHFICDKCDRVFDIDKYFPELSEQSDGLEGFRIKNHRLVLNGLCPDCVRESEGSAS